MTSRAAAARRHSSVRGVPEPVFLSPTTAAAVAAAAVRRGLASGAYADLIISSSSSAGLNETSNNVVDFSAGALLSETEQRAFADFLNRFATDDFLVYPSPTEAPPAAPGVGQSTNVALRDVAPNEDITGLPVGACPSGTRGDLPAEDDVKFGEASNNGGANATANSARESAAAAECGSDAPSVTKRKKSFSSSTPPIAKGSKPRGRRRNELKDIAAASADGAGNLPASSALIGGSNDFFDWKPGAGHKANGSRPIVVPGTRPGRRGAKGQDLLTESERKANHIASEQRRRQNIRIGFDTLCDLVPTLSQCHRSEALILQKCKLLQTYVRALMFRIFILSGHS
ncbi:MAG: hypothetical protein BJ554DRAFT_6549 [Olpidium bornovanus]|uniref:BHLH domain-containing protein n=1 Tax=Olpidium bornovanus TaxID=278681 RepID=A0A8H8DM29_9FUNG|nr:MAG: hypothetical protein BJ554DRAFT_6549 [Olpidium bornovanus]